MFAGINSARQELILLPIRMFVYGYWWWYGVQHTLCKYAVIQMSTGIRSVLATSGYFKRLWRNNERDGVSNHRHPWCLLNRLFRRRSKKTSKLCVIGLCEGNPSVTSGSPHKGPTMRKMFPFDDVIMYWPDVGNNGRTRSIPCLLMPWLLAMLVHRQWWLCPYEMICMWKEFNYLFQKLYKIK